MRRKKIFLPVILVGFVFSLTYCLQADDNDDNFYGNFMFGYRFVDTSGADFKYKEDINLDDGVRLFDFNLSYRPGDKLKKLLDRLDINVYNFGGDPFETLRISVQKNGKYKFLYDRKKAAYFYHDLHEVGSGGLYDLHTFDFERISDSGMLKIWLRNNSHFYLNFDRYTKKGDSVTTFDINRIEFEFDKPIREDSRTVTVGLDVNLKRYSFVLEEKIQDYENSNSLFLPGYADGGAGTSYPSALSFFVINQPYEFRTYTHTFKFVARPINNLLIAGSAQASELSMDLSYSEEANGINLFGTKFMYSYSGEGNFFRDFQLLDLDVSYLLFDKLAIIGAVRYNNLDQNGQLKVGNEGEDVDLGIDTLGVEGGLEYQFSPQFALTLGYRFETRDLEGTETVTYEERTKRNGFFGNLKAEITKNIKLTLDYQHGDYDDPYTLISPTSLNRLKATAKLRSEQLDISGSLLWSKIKNDIYDELWESEKVQLSLRGGYHNQTVKIFGGYSFIGIEHESVRTVAFPPSWSGPAGTFLWDIFYEGKSHLLDASLHVNLENNWRIGGYWNYYKNNGFWEISRAMLKGYLQYTFNNGLITQVGYRYVDFKEASSGFNDYKANIFEVSFGYRWK